MVLIAALISQNQFPIIQSYHTAKGFKFRSEYLWIYLQRCSMKILSFVWLVESHTKQCCYCCLILCQTLHSFQDLSLHLLVCLQRPIRILLVINSNCCFDLDSYHVFKWQKIRRYSQILVGFITSAEFYYCVKIGRLGQQTHFSRLSLFLIKKFEKNKCQFAVTMFECHLFAIRGYDPISTWYQSYVNQKLQIASGQLLICAFHDSSRDFDVTEA